MTLFETEAGHALSSTGSIAWCGILLHHGYRNDVLRITENMLRAFASDRSFPAETRE
jgi:N,N-dimethylformamidase